MPDVSIAPLTAERIAAAAEVYSRTSEGILPTLGEGLIREYLLALVSKPLSIVALSATADDRLAGFVIVTVPSGRETFLHIRRGFLVRYFCTHPQLLIRSAVWRHVAKLLELKVSTLLRPSLFRPKAAPAPMPRARLISLIVEPSYRRCGIGSHLLDRCEGVLRSKGYETWGLVVAPENQPAVRLYEGHGWTRLCPNGVWHGDMIKRLEEPAEQQADNDSGVRGSSREEDPGRLPGRAHAAPFSRDASGRDRYRWAKQIVRSAIRRAALFVQAQSQQAHLDALRSAGIVSIGKHTYGSPVISIGKGDAASVTIGPFVSMGPGVTFIPGGIHPGDRISLFPFRARWNLPGAYLDGTPATRGDIVVGADTWIGTGALILSGVTIGHGAIVAAHSVVTRNVPAYALVAGVPARVVRYRFSPETIERLLTIAWWEWDDATIRERVPTLTSQNAEEFTRRYSPASEHSRSPG